MYTMAEETLNVDNEALLIELRKQKVKLLNVKQAIKAWNKQLVEMCDITLELARSLETKDFIVRATEHKLRVMSDITEMLHKIDMKVRLVRETKTQYIRLQKLKARSGAKSPFHRILNLNSRERMSHAYLLKHDSLRSSVTSNLEDINCWRQQTDVIGFAASQSKIFLGFQTLIAGPVDERIERAYRLMERRLNNFHLDFNYKQKSLRSRASRRKLPTRKSTRGTRRRETGQMERKAKMPKSQPLPLMPYVPKPKYPDLTDPPPSKEEEEDESCESDTSEYASSDTNFAEREYYLSESRLEVELDL